MKYVILPESALKDNSLKPLTRLILAEIVSLSRHDGYCFATNPYFAKEYELNEKTVSRHLASLAKKKYIKIVVDKKRGNERKIFLAGNFKKQVDEIWNYNENKKIEEEQLDIENNVIDNITDDIIKGEEKEDKPKKKETPDIDERYNEVISYMNKISKRRFMYDKKAYPLGMNLLNNYSVEDIKLVLSFVYNTYYSDNSKLKYDKKHFNPESVFRNFSKHWNKCEAEGYKVPKTDENGNIDEKFKFYYIEDGELKGTNIKLFDKDCFKTKEEALKHKSSL